MGLVSPVPRALSSRGSGSLPRPSALVRPAASLRGASLSLAGASQAHSASSILVPPSQERLPIPGQRGVSLSEGWREAGVFRALLRPEVLSLHTAALCVPLSCISLTTPSVPAAGVLLPSPGTQAHAAAGPGPAGISCWNGPLGSPHTSPTVSRTSRPVFLVKGSVDMSLYEAGLCWCDWEWSAGPTCGEAVVPAGQVDAFFSVRPPGRRVD